MTDVTTLAGPNKNNWRRLPISRCACGCGQPVAKRFKKGHGRRRPVLLRLVERLRQDGDCWTWTGAVSTGGYGRIGTGPRSVGQVHRVAYEQLVGAIPAGLHIDHLCRNRLCCNPAHLEAVTQAENNLRAYMNPEEHRTRGTTDPAEQYVLMTLGDLVALLTGTRDHLDDHP